jgi:hypothetical protein
VTWRFFLQLLVVAWFSLVAGMVTCFEGGGRKTSRPEASGMVFWVDFSMRRSARLTLAIVAAAVELIPIAGSISQPSNCACDRPQLGPAPTSLPDPEGRHEAPQVFTEKPSAASGSRVVSATSTVGFESLAQVS